MKNIWVTEVGFKLNVCFKWHQISPSNPLNNVYNITCSIVLICEVLWFLFKISLRCLSLVSLWKIVTDFFHYITFICIFTVFSQIKTSKPVQRWRPWWSGWSCEGTGETLILWYFYTITTSPITMWHQCCVSDRRITRNIIRSNTQEV